MKEKVMQTIYAVQIYTFEDWNIHKWFDSEESANNAYQAICVKDPNNACFYKLKSIVNDAMGNNFRFFNISKSNKGE
jgi:hypothetical protein